MISRRLIGWVIIRNSTYWNYIIRKFQSQCSKDCFYTTTDKNDCDMIASNLKCEVVAVWVGK